MPQLDPAFFAPQLFWLAVSFIVLYVLMSRLAMPQIAGVLKQREDKIQGDLETAQRLKDETKSVIAAYEKALADARGEAQALARQTSDAASAESARWLESGGHGSTGTRDLARCRAASTARR